MDSSIEMSESMKDGYTAGEAAAILLANNDINNWKVKRLAFALLKLSESKKLNGDPNKRTAYHDDLDGFIYTGNSNGARIKVVSNKLADMSFIISWEGEYGSRIFRIQKHEKDGGVNCCEQKVWIDEAT